MKTIKVKALQGMASKGDLWRKGEEREINTDEAVRLLNARMVERVEEEVEQAVKPAARRRKRKSE